MRTEHTATKLTHLGRRWKVISDGKRYFAKDGQSNLTGPWATTEETIDWIKSIVPA